MASSGSVYTLTSSTTFTSAQMSTYNIPSPDFGGRIDCWVEFDRTSFNAVGENNLENTAEWGFQKFNDVVASSGEPDIGGLKTKSKAKIAGISALLMTILISS